MSEIAVHLTDPALAGDAELLDTLRRGDERAFIALVSATTRRCCASR